jgi:hypothetical protein
MPVIPPDTVAAGQTGHIQAHQEISDVLTAHDTQLAGLPAMARGTATLSGGTVTVAASEVTAASAVLVSRMGPSGTLGHLAVPTINPGVSFVITSTSASDNSVVAYLIV